MIGCSELQRPIRQLGLSMFWYSSRIARNLLPDVFAPCRRKEKKKAKLLPGLSVLNKKIIRATTVSSDESETDQRTVPSPHPSRPVPTQTVVRKMRVQRLRPAVGTETKALSKTLADYVSMTSLQ